MKRAALALALVAVAASAALASPAAAGGWAVTTLDPIPALEAGKPVAVGFTIRQHGVTPVELTGVEIVVHSDGGGPGLVFPARPDGPLGHYVAEVTLPAEAKRWEVVQGWFGPQDLGPLVIAAGSPARGADPGWPAPVRYGLLVLTVGAAAVFIATLIWRPRRRPGTAPA